jgi:hypothetical protein
MGGASRAGQNAWDLFLRTLAWPSWSLGGGDNVLARDLRALLLIVFVAAIIGMAASSTGPAPDRSSWAGSP